MTPYQRLGPSSPWRCRMEVRACFTSLFCVAGLLCSTVARAIPDPNLSTQPSALVLTILSNNAPLVVPAVEAKYVIIDDVLHTPIAGAVVTIDMGACAGLFPGPGIPGVGLACGAMGAVDNV